LKFAGDAILVAWPLEAVPDARSDAAAAAAAAACALCMLSLQSASLAPGEPPVALHIALHVGQLAEMHVGNGGSLGGRWEHLCTGDALTELSPLIAAAEAGECIASHALWRLLEGGAVRGPACAHGARVASLLPSATDAYVPAPAASSAPLSPAALAALAAYLPPALADSLEAAQQSWMAELRHVSVLFILLPPCGASDFALVQALVAEVHECVGRTGGTPQQSIADDKGTVSIGVWGKPLASHADDPARALAAACELSVSLARIAASFGRGEPISCGVCTGRAFCGNVGASQRCEWAVVGDVMNNAARLMMSAASLRRSVLCDAATARHVGDAAADAGLPPPDWLEAAPLEVTLKGQAAPVRVFSPDVLRASTPPTPAGSVAGLAGFEGRRSLDSQRSSFDSQRSSRDGRSSTARRASGGIPERRVSALEAGPGALCGREAELARCAALLRDAPSRADGLLLVVTGSVSSGKSSFIRAVATEAKARGTAVLPLASAPTQVGSVGSVFNMPWFADAADARLDSLPPSLRPLAPLLAELAPSAGFTPHALAVPASAAALRALEGDAPARAAAAAALAVDILRPLLAGGAAVLLADDASAMDAPSASLLAAVQRELHPTLLLAMPRQELEDPNSGGAELIAALADGAAACRTVMLGPLPPSAVAALCTAELGAASVDALPPGLVPALMRLAGGHPLLLKEQLALLRRGQHLRVDAAGGVHAGCDMARLPELVAQGLLSEEGIARMEVFIQRRIDALSPEARAAVKAAAVLGGSWDLPMLLRCCAPRFSFASVCAAAAELVHEGMWTMATQSLGGEVRYTFAHEVVRSLVYAATPEDTRAGLHAILLECLEAHGQAALGVAAAAGADSPQSAAVWSELARLARGANQHVKAASCFMQAARVSFECGTVTGPAEAARAAREGLESVAAAAAARCERRARADSQHAPAPPRLSDHAAGARRRSVSACWAAADAAPPAESDAASADADPECADLSRELSAILARVQRVQASWSLVQPALTDHALAMTHAFVGRCPSVLELVVGKHGTPLTDPSMGAVMVAHQCTLLTLVGTCVAGERDFDALVPTLVACGRMHSRFGDSIQQFYPHCGAAMLDAVRGALGEAFTADVETAWTAVFDFVMAQMLKGVGQAQSAHASEGVLRVALAGQAVEAA
jgi:hypothetical protein